MKSLIVLLIQVLLMVYCGSTQEGSMVPGSYIEQNIEEDFVQRAYQFSQVSLATGGQGYQLKSLDKAESQVVAGTKIRLYCSAEKDKVMEKILVTVFEDLDGKHELVSIEKQP